MGRDNVMDVKVMAGSPQTVKTEVLVCMHFETASGIQAEVVPIDRAMGGGIRSLITSGEFTGKANQTVLYHVAGNIPAKRVLLVGLGKKGDVRLDTIRQALGTVRKRVRQIGVDSFHVLLPVRQFSKLPSVHLTQAIVEGGVLGGYEFNEFLSDKKTQSKQPGVLTIVLPNASSLSGVKEGARRGQASAEATWFVRDLCNHPSNYMTPTMIAGKARQVAKERGVTLKILERREMERLGMGGLLGVARGSHEPPKFLILEYRGPAKGKKDKDRAPIVLVGKTVTFDTGGISLKPSENMERMKADMTGGAEVLATIRAIARLQLPLHVVGLLPTTENMPGGQAIKPGDVLRMLSGKTVEVQNTDAEGRLILADGLAYARRYRPRAILDVATLTGACSVALGKFAIGMFGTQTSLKTRMVRAGDLAGERVWEMPLWPEYFEQLKSEVADMRNIGGRGGGMITAALFLKQFVGDTPWIHLDIASTDWSDGERPYIAKGPTGIGTRLILQFLFNEAA